MKVKVSINLSVEKFYLLFGVFFSGFSLASGEIPGREGKNACKVRWEIGVIGELFRSNGVAERRFLLVRLELVFRDLSWPTGVFFEELEAGVSGSVGQLGDQVVVVFVDGFLARVELVIADKVDEDSGVLVHGSVEGSVQGSEGGPPGVKVVLVAIEDPDLVMEFSNPRTCSLQGRIASGDGVLISK